VHPEEYWFRAKLPVQLRTCWDRTRLLVHEKFPCRSEYLAVRLRNSLSCGDAAAFTRLSVTTTTTPFTFNQ
jgi:hypothetical protein